MELTRYNFYLFVILLLVCINNVLCYPDGPPLSVCDTGLPIHLGNNGTPYAPQTSQSPFQINVNVTSYKPGDVIAVTVTSDVGEMFKGLFVQVRKIRNVDEKRMEDFPVGSFHRRIVNTRIVSCELGMNTVTHSDPYLKVSAILNWRAPLLMNNDVIIRATILTNFSTFWTNVESQRIKLFRPRRLPAENMEKPWLEEVVKNVHTKGDKIKSRELVKSRFERGFKGVMDPHGYIMVHYVMDLLPFYSSHYGINNTQHNGIGIHVHVNTSDMFDQVNNTTIAKSSSITGSHTVSNISKDDDDSKVANNSTSSNNSTVIINPAVNTSSKFNNMSKDARNSTVGVNSTLTNGVSNSSTETNSSTVKKDTVNVSRKNSAIAKSSNITDNVDAGRHNATIKTTSKLSNSHMNGSSSGDITSKAISNGFTKQSGDSKKTLSRQAYEELIRSVLADDRDAAKTLDTYLHREHRTE